MRAIVPKLAVIATTMTTMLFWSTPAQAKAAALSCGSTVSGSVSLNHDLHCHGDGLVLLRGSLNMHGHTIFGDGTGAGLSLADQVGSTDHASITNGTITRFAVGVQHLGSDDLVLTASKLEISESSAAALRTQPNTKGTLDRVSITKNDMNGIDQTLGGHLVVTHSTVEHNGLGIFLSSDASIDLTRVKIRANSAAITCSQGRVGLKHSDVSENGAGINLFECEGSVLDDSTFVGNERTAVEETEGLPGFAEPTLTVSGDLFKDNAVGVHLTPFAITTVVRQSVFTHNGSGIVMDACGAAPCFPVSDELVGNLFARNAHDGVRWGYGTVSLSRNHFNNNGGWGFIADPTATVVDGGGNMAHGNHAGDCKGLSCR